MSCDTRLYDGPELRAWMDENLVAQRLFRERDLSSIVGYCPVKIDERLGAHATTGDWFPAGGYRTCYKGKWHISHADIEIPGTHDLLMSNTDAGVPISRTSTSTRPPTAWTTSASAAGSAQAGYVATYPQMFLPQPTIELYRRFYYFLQINVEKYIKSEEARAVAHENASAGRPRSFRRGVWHEPPSERSGVLYDV
jgi:hypothetical protein